MTYQIYIEGTFEVEADNESEAKFWANQMLKQIKHGKHKICVTRIT